jgi:hypothetical protein
MIAMIEIEDYAKIAARLLRTDIDAEDSLWEGLLTHQIALTEYFAKIGLQLYIDKDNGFAFLKQIELDESGTTIGLARRIPLGFEISLICVLLREMLEEHDSSDTFAKQLFIRHRQLREQVELFFQEKANRVKFLKNLDAYIQKLVELGFLKVKTDHEILDERLYEVKRILKAKITFEQLEEFKERLKSYVESI